MGKFLNTRTIIDPDTGEIMKEEKWLGYDGFNETGYQYRRRAIYIRYYFDALPENLSKNAWILLFMIAELMNEENMLVYRIPRKSKFSTVIYKPLDKDDIAERIRFKYGKNKFDSAWRELTKHCLKKIKYHEYMAWAVNPSVISKCKFVPIWLYEEFKIYMNPYLNSTTIKKLQNRINSQYE